MADSLARRERRDLCDLALVLGPDAPTLCEGWTSSDLMAHLVVRERNPVAAAGNAVPRLAGINRRAMDREQSRGYEVLVERYRKPAAFLRALRPVDEAMNAFELLVHHEDLRRGGDSLAAAGSLRRRPGPDLESAGEGDRDLRSPVARPHRAPAG